MAAGRTFTEEAQKHLRVRFADEKTAIVSSHQKLALSVARQLGLQKEAAQTVGLGVDVSAGETRTVTSEKKEEDTKSPQEKSQTASANETSAFAGSKDLQVWPAPSCHVWG